jgi:hypothetical protein
MRVRNGRRKTEDWEWEETIAMGRWGSTENRRLIEERRGKMTKGGSACVKREREGLGAEM